MFKEESFAPLYQVERNRAEDKVEMPQIRSGINRLPDITNTRNGCFKQSEPCNFVWILRGECIGHHQADIVPDKIDIFVPETFHELVNVVGYCLLVITCCWTRRVAEATQVRGNDGVVFPEL